MSIKFKGDFLGFSFNNKHSSLFSIVRTSAGDRHSYYAFSDFSDTYQTVPGKDGEYYFGTTVRGKRIDFNIAFDEMTDRQISELTQWLNPRVVSSLILDEHPYKQYIAKLVSPPTLNFVPFDGEDVYETVYRGEGSISFYVHDPNALSTSPFLDEYTDEFGEPWSTDHAPPWLWSGQLIPKCKYNTIGWQKPPMQENIYIGGTTLCPMDIWIEFLSAGEISGALSGYIDGYQSEITTTDILIHRAEGNIKQLDLKIKHLTTQKIESEKIIEENNKNIAVLSPSILQKQSEILAKRSELLGKNSKLTEIRSDLLDTRSAQVAVVGKLSEKESLLNSLLEIQNPNDEKITEIKNLKVAIEQLENENNALSATINAFLKTISETEEEVTIIRETIAELTESMEIEKTRLANLKSENSELAVIISKADEEIAPTQNSYDINKKEVVRLKERRAELVETISDFQGSGVSLDGSQIKITKAKQKDNPAQELVITLKEELKGKTLRINANTGDMCYYDKDGRRFDYFEEITGKPIIAAPTGYNREEQAIFKADASGSNILTLNKPLTDEADLVGDFVIFKEDVKSSHTVTKILNVRENNGKVELVLEEPYFLTNGEKRAIILNPLLGFKFSDLRYVKQVNVVHPYRYY